MTIETRTNLHVSTKYTGYTLRNPNNTGEDVQANQNLPTERRKPPIIMGSNRSLGSTYPLRSIMSLYLVREEETKIT